ncbi:Zn-dependent protease with chaperone function [Kitasatospora sp. MAA4]|uniref:M48 family metalloprotease n=1 Tax=Kitasatospora sp. MAA4 TaxID=3035093 RepID=UPI0024759730|nr:M48 family metalloprotease [Kitasatospora sp. MAA4]MDH6132695.1 Zn-dependent protease with chaperone function [Kitasatospora sp. MAA4]
MPASADAPPPYPGEAPPPACPAGDPPPAYPGTPSPKALPHRPPVPPPPAHPPLLPPQPPPLRDDLPLQSGRTYLKARQRGADGAAISQLVVTLPTALVSLGVVATVFSMVNPVLGLVGTVLWLLSGALVFHRPTEAAIAQHLLAMRRPDPATAQRLAVVWEEVTRRAGVRHGTYELWIEERDELNATAAAGHIVGVTRHAMDRLPNSQLAAILAHELGHHVGGHTWAGLLAHWYALPARMLGRVLFAGVSALMRSKSAPGVGCGGCLILVMVSFVATLTFEQGMWWLVVPVAVAPLFVAWLHRRAEFRADDYAAGLGFGEELTAVLAQEHRSRTTPVAFPSPPPSPWPHPPQPGGPYSYPAPPAYAPPPPHAMVTPAAHRDLEARLQRLHRNR